MSHFTVLVIGADHEALLAPFDENRQDVFDDLEDEYKEEYETKSRDMKRLPDGTLVSPYDDRFKVGGTTFGWSSDDRYKFPEGTQDVSVPFKELYSTFEEFVVGWHGHEERDEKTGRYGCWKCANAKWDWYQVGGRWSGTLKLKPGVEGEFGKRSWMNEHEPLKQGTCDSALAGDVDWDGMLNERRQELTKLYTDVTCVIAGREFTPWADFYKRVEANEIAIDEARQLYHAQPVYIDLTTGETPVINGWGSGETIADIISTKDINQYVNEQSKIGSITWALVTPDGKWHEKGEMGWFGANDATKDSKIAFADFWWDTIRKLSPDTRVTVVDCHI